MDFILIDDNNISRLMSPIILRQELLLMESNSAMQREDGRIVDFLSEEQTKKLSDKEAFFKRINFSNNRKIKIDEIIIILKNLISASDFSELISLMTFNRSQFFAIVYLLMNGDITDTDINEILYINPSDRNSFLLEMLLETNNDKSSSEKLDDLFERMFVDIHSELLTASGKNPESIRTIEGKLKILSPSFTLNSFKIVAEGKAALANGIFGGIVGLSATTALIASSITHINVKPFVPYDLSLKPENIVPWFGSREKRVLNRLRDFYRDKNNKGTESRAELFKFIDSSNASDIVDFDFRISKMIHPYINRFLPIVYFTKELNNGVLTITEDDLSNSMKLSAAYFFDSSVIKKTDSGNITSNKFESENMNFLGSFEKLFKGNSDILSSNIVQSSNAEKFTSYLTENTYLADLFSNIFTTNTFKKYKYNTKSDKFESSSVNTNSAEDKRLKDIGFFTDSYYFKNKLSPTRAAYNIRTSYFDTDEYPGAISSVTMKKQVPNNKFLDNNNPNKLRNIMAINFRLLNIKTYENNSNISIGEIDKTTFSKLASNNLTEILPVIIRRYKASNKYDELTKGKKFFEKETSFTELIESTRTIRDSFLKYIDDSAASSAKDPIWKEIGMNRDSYVIYTALLKTIIYTYMEYLIDPDVTNLNYTLSARPKDQEIFEYLYRISRFTIDMNSNLTSFYKRNFIKDYMEKIINYVTPALWHYSY